MEKKIAKLYKESTIATYKELLKDILAANFAADFRTYRENVSVAMVFMPDDTDAVDEMAQLTKNMEVVISDAAIVTVPNHKEASEPTHLINEIATANAEIASLRSSFDALKKERDGYRGLWAEEKRAKNRITSQIQSIKTILDGLFPGK